MQKSNFEFIFVADCQRFKNKEVEYYLDHLYADIISLPLSSILILHRFFIFRQGHLLLSFPIFPDELLGQYPGLFIRVLLGG